MAWFERLPLLVSPCCAGREDASDRTPGTLRTLSISLFFCVESHPSLTHVALRRSFSPSGLTPGTPSAGEIIYIYLDGLPLVVVVVAHSQGDDAYSNEQSYVRIPIVHKAHTILQGQLGRWIS